jgi:transglutaminase-like putative cysteine protease
MTAFPYDEFQDSVDDPRSRQVMRTRPMFPEGILSPVLLVAMIALAGLCVEQSGWSRIVLPMAVLAGLGTAFGAVLSKTRIAASVAHLLAIVLGICIPLALVVQRSDLEGGYRERLAEISRLTVDWYLGEEIGEHLESLYVSLLMGIILWLVGYLGGWTLFRHGWLLTSILLPGFLILVNLGYGDEPKTGFLVAYAFLALMLIARQNFFLRSVQWRYSRLKSPSSLRSGFAVSGTIVAVVATLVGVLAPTSLSQATLQPLVTEVSTSVLSAQDRMAEWLEDARGEPPPGAQINGGSFSAFDDSFSVGGPLELSDEPQVVVSAEYGPYLSAQTFDSYSGRGWYSTTKDTFNPEGADGRTYSPEMTFAPNQQIPVSNDENEARVSQAMEITPLTSFDGRMLTVDTYQAASVQASVRMSWVQLDGYVFDLSGPFTEEMPRDLNRIASLLQAGSLEGADSASGPMPENAGLRAEIERELTQLEQRFLTVTWTTDENGLANQMTVSGQIPIYDDVEAVFAGDQLESGGTYRVLASTTVADSGMLATAGQDYPEWVTDRYLQLPNSITTRSNELTQEITAGLDNPYDMARAIESYIRANMVYDETVEAPPEDADIVDYLLFERQRGYCEYSASAMTVMLRMLGIPARVVVGFAPGDYDESRDGYVYLQSNAHAWTEVFFPGYGWIPFEPTPSESLIATAPGEQVDDLEPLSTQTPDPETPLADELDPLAAATPEATGDAAGAIPPVVTPSSTDDGTNVPWPLLAGVGAVVAVIAAGWLLWSLPLRNATPGTAMFLRLRRVGRWLGVSSSPTSTPREYGRAFADQVPSSRQNVERIVKTFEIDQYGPERADSGVLRAAEEAWHSIRRQAPRWLLRWRR